MDTQFDAQSITAESYFAGLYGHHQMDRWSLDFALTAGFSDHETSRDVANNQVAGGIEIAQASYDGYFIAPEITLGTDLSLMGHIVRPSLRTGYVGTWFGSYIETGTVAPLSVNERQVHVLENRFQLAVVVSEDANHAVELRTGVDSQLILGGAKIDASLLEQGLSFDPGGDDASLSGFIGADFSAQIADNVAIFASAELGTGTQVSLRADVQIGARISF